MGACPAEKRSSFEEDLAFSHKESKAAYWVEAYKRFFNDPRVCVYDTRPTEDVSDQGIDHLVQVPSRGKRYTVDTKIHRSNPRWVYEDDKVFLEYEHCYPDGAYKKEGWIEDKTKLCDYLAYAKKETGIVYIFPFKDLQGVWEENKDAWLAVHKITSTPNPTWNDPIYISNCVLVPASEIYQKLQQHFTVVVPEKFWR